MIVSDIYKMKASVVEITEEIRKTLDSPKSKAQVVKELNEYPRATVYSNIDRLIELAKLNKPGIVESENGFLKWISGDEVTVRMRLECYFDIIMNKDSNEDEKEIATRKIRTLCSDNPNLLDKRLAKIFTMQLTNKYLQHDALKQLYALILKAKQFNISKVRELILMSSDILIEIAKDRAVDGHRRVIAIDILKELLSEKAIPAIFEIIRTEPQESYSPLDPSILSYINKMILQYEEYLQRELYGSLLKDENKIIRERAKFLLDRLPI